MTEVNPPLYLDQSDAYTAANLGLPFRDIMGEGVVGSGDLLVSQDTGSDLKCSVAAGAAWVKGDDDVNAQPTYRVRNAAAVLLQHSTADATNPRIDLIIAEVLDSTFSGTSKLWRLRIVNGAATTGATLTNLTGAASVPNNAIALAYVLIPAGSGAVTTAHIQDVRVRAKVGGGGASDELAYGQTVTNTSVTATTEATANVVATAANAITTDGVAQVWIEFEAYGVNPAGSTLSLWLYDGASSIGAIGVATAEVPINRKVRITPTEGSHTYSIRASIGSGTGSVFGDSGPGTAKGYPAYIRVTRA